MKKTRTQSNPRSLANLLKGQWEPGRSGNPSGRPKKKPIGSAMQLRPVVTTVLVLAVGTQHHASGR
jgi:hypothetical protein